MRRSVFGAPGTMMAAFAFFVAIVCIPSLSSAQEGNVCSNAGNTCYAPYSCASGQPPTTGVGCHVFRCEHAEDVGQLDPNPVGQCDSGSGCMSQYRPCSGETCYSDGDKCYVSCSGTCDVKVCKITSTNRWRSSGNCNEETDCRQISPTCN